MEENQTNQNVQTSQPASQSESSANQASVSMQIQQLLAQQQQYQQQYNELVNYVKETPNLPIEQVNQIKLQLDQLNASFVQWKQKLQALWYNPVQVHKPTQLKSWSKRNLSFKKLAIGCGMVVLLILLAFFVTLSSLRKNPDALLWMWIEAWTAKILLQLFAWLLFWSLIILMLGVVVSNIYRLITVKNQSRAKNLLWLIWWLFWAWIIWAIMWSVFWWIGQIVTEKVQVSISPVQPYLVGMVENKWVDEFDFPYDSEWISGKDYPLIAPSELAFKVRWNQIVDYQYNKLWQETTLQSISLLCGNPQNKRLELSWDIAQVANWNMVAFQWTCLYWQKWDYTYSLEITYRNNLTKEENIMVTEAIDTLHFDSEVKVSLTTRTSNSSNNKTERIYPTNWEFLLWKAPAKITIDTTQIFRDFWLSSYNVIWDLDWDKNTDRTNQVSFDYLYKSPQVYYPSVKFSDLWDFVYTFPVRVEQSDRPVCWINVERFPWTTKYQISTDFIDASSAATISKYDYTIKNAATKELLENLKDYPQEFNYTFPERWNYIIILDYVTIDGKQWQCESDIIQLAKEMFDIKYSIFSKNSDSVKFTELCSSESAEWCKSIHLDSVPQTFQIHIKSVSPYSSTTKKTVYFQDKPVLNENDTYTFDITDEWTFFAKILVSDPSRWIDDKVVEISFTAKKPDIVWNITITSRDTRQPISEWFEPLTVILDASKTELNVPWDEIVFFTRDFGDWEVKKDQQNWVVAHTYNYDYVNENWIFEPKVTIKTKEWLTQTITGPKLNVKKWLINIDLSSSSHPSRQAQLWKEVIFQADFDGLPERMIWDFGDGTQTLPCHWRTCTEIKHTFKETWLFTVRLTLESDTIQQVDWTMDFKVF